MSRKQIEEFDKREMTVEEIFARRIGEMMNWYYRAKIRENVMKGLANAKRKKG